MAVTGPGPEGASNVGSAANVPAQKEAKGIRETITGVFTQMQTTAAGAIDSIKGLVVQDDKTEAGGTEKKTMEAVKSVFTKTLPNFGNRLLHITPLGAKIDNFIRERNEARSNKMGDAFRGHFDIARNGSKENGTASEAKPTKSLSDRLSDIGSRVSTGIPSRINSLADKVPNPLNLFKKQEAGEAHAGEAVQSAAPRSIANEMPQFLNKVASQQSVDYKSEEYKKKMVDAHDNMRNTLGIVKDEKRQVTYEAGLESQNGWKVKINPKKVYDFMGAKIKGSTLLGLQKKTRVTYDKNKVDPKALSDIIRDGSQNSSQQMQASGRCIVSTDILASDHLGNVRNVDTENPATFQTYTISAPNIAYNPKMKEAMSVTGAEGTKTVDMGKWETEMTRLFTHALQEAKRDGLEMVVLPAIGMGAFMPDNLKGEAKARFLNAVEQAKKNAGAENIQIVVTGRELEGLQSSDPSIHVVGNKDSFGVLASAIDSGFKVGLVNAGDPSAQTGQLASAEGKGPYAQEEAFAIKAPTLMINQNFNANKAVGNPSAYIASEP